MERRIAALSGHTIIAGCGRTGQFVLEELLANALPFVVIDRRPDMLEHMNADHRGSILYVVGGGPAPAADTQLEGTSATGRRESGRTVAQAARASAPPSIPSRRGIRAANRLRARRRVCSSFMHASAPLTAASSCNASTASSVP